MAKVIANSQGKVVLANNKALLAPPPSIDFPKYTGHVDTVGLTALGWDSDDIQWLQDHVWWDAEDDAYWAVTEANLAFGPNGATPLTWANRASVKNNPDVRYFPKFDLAPSSDTSWYGLFLSYSFVYAIPTHGWDVSHVTRLDSLFNGCMLLCSVGDLSGWNIANANTLGAMFSGCPQLRSVGDLSAWNVGNVTNMGNLFQGCYKLEYVGDLSNWNTAKVTSFLNMFYQCYSLSSVGDLGSWNVGNATTFSQMFYDCRYLQYIGDLSNWNTSKVRSLQGLFSGCLFLSNIGDISNWDVSQVETMNSTFSNCSSLSYIGNLSNWDVGNVTNMLSMFYNCISLRTFGDISNWNVKKVTSFNSTFYRCASVSRIDLSMWEPSSCTTIGSSWNVAMFSFSNQLREIKLGSHFFDGPATSYMFRGPIKWTRDSVYESLYTNQTLRTSQSTAITITLDAEVYDSLSAQDISDIATKNITLTRG